MAEPTSLDQAQPQSRAEPATSGAPSEWADLRRIFLDTLYRQTAKRILLYQRGRRLKTFPSIEAVKRAPSAAARRKSSLAAAPRAADDLEAADMPSETVLNAIKLERELDALLHIFAVADEANGATSEPAAATERLCAAIEVLRQDSSKEEQLAAELQSNRATLRALKAQLDSERREADERRSVQEDRLSTLRHHLANVRRVNELELSLVQRWEENRCFQAGIVCSNEEGALQRELATLLKRIADERRIVHEVQKYRMGQQAELRDRIAEWQRKFADELAAMEAETRDKEQRSTKLHKTWEQHRETYEERVRYVEEYLAEKAEARRLHEQQVHRIECAVRIQAWWRGVMVRRGFGPFRKKAKRGKKAKGKGK